MLILIVITCISNGLLASELPTEIIRSFVKTKTTYLDQKTNKYVDIYGTGTIINFNGESFILTASHVVGGENTIVFIDQKITQVKMLEVDNYWDYAILKLDRYHKSLFSLNSQKMQIETVLASDSCLIPNLYAEPNEQKNLSFRSTSNQQSSIFFEHIILSLGIKPKMSGSPLICNGKLIGVLKAFNRVHDVSYATESYLAFNIFLKNPGEQEKSRYNFFIKANWYLYNKELFRKFRLKTGETFVESINILQSNYRKNAGGGVRSDGGGSDKINDSKNFDKKDNLYFRSFGFVNSKKQYVYGFRALSNSNWSYFLANETSLVFLNGFKNSSNEFELSMYDDFDKVEEVKNQIDLIKILKERDSNLTDEVKSSHKNGRCELTLNEKRSVRIDLKLSKEKLSASYELKIESPRNIDQQLVYKYDDKNKMGIDFLGLFFTDLGFIKENDLLVMEDNTSKLGVVKSNYNLPYVIVKQENRNPLVLPCFLIENKTN